MSLLNRIDRAIAELEEIRAEVEEVLNRDPRRRRTLSLALRVARADEAMRHLEPAERNAALRERFSRGVRQIQRLRALGRDANSSRAPVVESNHEPETR